MCSRLSAIAQVDWLFADAPGSFSICPKHKYPTLNRTLIKFPFEYIFDILN